MTVREDGVDPGAAILATRLTAARSLAEAADGRLPVWLRARLDEVVDRSSERLAVAGDHTVVVLAGPTGVGKSSLFNALLDVDLATPGVMRPTTDTPLAAVVSAEPVAELMAHAGLTSWQHVAVSSQPMLESLVLVDLPDHDSVVTAHREQAAELVAVADRLLWVVDPEKYADASVHEDLLAPLHEHAGVLTMVVNRIDRLGEREAREVVADLRRLLQREHLGGAEVVATSARTGEGLPELRGLLARSITEHRAANERIAADLRALARDLDPVVPEVPDEGLDAGGPVVAAAMDAAGVPAVVDAVAATHRHRARRATGWPVLRRLQARGRDPLARLGLRRGRSTDGVGSRTSRSVPHGVATAGLATAVRERVDELTTGWPPGWSDPVDQRLDEVVETLPVRLDRAIAGADLDDDHRPGWWLAVGALQWLLAVAMVVGGLWLLAAFVVGWLQLPALPLPGWRGIPWATILLVGGAVAGVLVGFLSGQVARVGARRAARRVRRRLHERVAGVVDDTITQSLAAESSRAAAARRHLDVVAGR